MAEPSAEATYEQDLPNQERVLLVDDDKSFLEVMAFLL